MRRTITFAAVAITALGLSACGGGTADLTQDKAKSSLIEASDLPDGGWTAGSINETKPKGEDSSEEFLKDAKDVSQECKDAFKGMAAISPKDAKAYAKRSYTKGSDSNKEEVEIVVATYDQAKDAPAKLATIADTCKTIKLSSGSTDVELTVTSPSLKADGAKALDMSMELMGQKQSMVMAATAVGNNLVAATSQGKDDGKVKDLVDTALTKSVDKVKKNAG